MASVTAALTDFKVKIELQLKEEMKKLEDTLVAKITKEVDDKLSLKKSERNLTRVQALLKHLCEMRLPMYVNMPFTTNSTAERTAYAYLA